MQYISKPKVVSAIKFLGEDEGMPSWVSVRGTKLPAHEREAEFHNKIHDTDLRAKYGDWILYTEDGDRWPCKDNIFQNSYELYSKPVSYPQINKPKESFASIPTADGNTMHGLGFR